MAEHDVEQVWHDFWIPVLDDACEGVPMGGTVEIPASYFDQIKRELFDYRTLVKKLPAFFDDITGGKCSKPNTDLEVVRQLVSECNQEAYDAGYTDGNEDGHAIGFDAGLEEARNTV